MVCLHGFVGFEIALKSQDLTSSLLYLTARRAAPASPSPWLRGPGSRKKKSRQDGSFAHLSESVFIPRCEQASIVSAQRKSTISGLTPFGLVNQRSSA
jgi:hypothetical protein